MDVTSLGVSCNRTKVLVLDSPKLDCLLCYRLDLHFFCFFFSAYDLTLPFSS